MMYNCYAKLDHTLNLHFKKGTSIRSLLEEAEKEIYECVFKDNKYEQSISAFQLGVSRSTFRKKMSKWFGSKYIGHRSNSKVQIKSKPNQENTNYNRLLEFFFIL